MTDNEGSITTEVKDHIFLIGLNRPEKLNGYTPTMATQLVDAMTELDTNDELWVGVLFAHGDHFTAGLDYQNGQTECPRMTELIPIRVPA